MYLHLIILMLYRISGIESFKQNTSSRDAFVEPRLREICKAARIFLVEMLESAKPYRVKISEVMLYL